MHSYSMQKLLSIQPHIHILTYINVITSLKYIVITTYGNNYHQIKGVRSSPSRLSIYVPFAFNSNNNHNLRGTYQNVQVHLTFMIPLELMIFISSKV